jgi:hypothetical protein
VAVVKKAVTQHSFRNTPFFTFDPLTLVSSKVVLVKLNSSSCSKEGADLSASHQQVPFSAKLIEIELLTPDEAGWVDAYLNPKP